MLARGVFFILVSALLFALSTVFGKLVVDSSRVTATELTFFRFAAGFIVFGGYALVAGKSLRPVAPRYILSRSVFNTCAVLFFFVALEYSNVTKVNMMNMTYPVFVFILAPFINREKVGRVSYLYLAVVMAGTYLVAVPAGGLSSFAQVNRGDILALVSAVFAAFAVAYLREAVKYDEGHVILFYLMGLGAAITGVLTVPVFVMPTGMIAVHSFLATAAAVAGQFFITAGQQYVDAAMGSLVSTARIVFAMVLGAAVFGDPLTGRILAGAALILAAICGASGALRLIRAGMNR